MFRVAPGIGRSVVTQYCAYAGMPAAVQAVQAVWILDWRRLGRYQAILTYSRAGYLAWPRMRASIRKHWVHAPPRQRQRQRCRRELWSPSTHRLARAPEPTAAVGLLGAGPLAFASFLPACLYAVVSESNDVLAHRPLFKSTALR